MPEWIWNKTVTKLSTSPNECHYATLWNTACVLFTTTVMHALNVMANWQLWANTLQRMFNVFAFGFDKRVMTISPLIKCLIIDALFDAVNSCTQRFFRHFSWMSLCMMRLINLCEMSVSMTIWRVVLCVPGVLTEHQTLTASMFSAVRDVRGLLLPGCRSVVPVSHSFFRR